MFPEKISLSKTNKSLTDYLALVFFMVGFLLFFSRAAETLCIKNPKANLRKGPGTHYKKVWEVFQYMPFKELGKKGNWHRVQDLDGDIYWVYGKLVTRSYRCAVIKNNKTNMRQGPGTKFPKVPWSPVNKYFSMKVLKIKNNWVHIEDGAGDRAWVYRPLVWIH